MATNPKKRNYMVPIITLTTLFFMWGFITCLNDLLSPFLQGIFHLSHFEANLVQFAFFIAYFVVSLIYFIISATIGDPILKIGYKNMIVIGLLLSSIACFGIFFEATDHNPAFGVFLAFLFLLGAGFTFLQIAANPLVSLLGTSDTASSRLNLSQAFNSLGTTLAPIIGGHFIFKQLIEYKNNNGIVQDVSVSTLQEPYLFLGSVLFILAGVIFFTKIPNEENRDKTEKLEKKVGALQYPHLVFGMIAIFCYVGAEVAIGNNLIVYMFDYHNLGKSEAAPFLAFYWGGAMIGRFMGSISMSKIEGFKKYLLMAVTGILATALIYFITDVKLIQIVYFFAFLILNYLIFIIARSIPSRILGCFAGINILLIITMLLTQGSLSLWTILAVGLFNSIMFSNIFTLAIDGLGKYTSQGSSLLVMMILGGAVIPPLFGLIADWTKPDTHIAFILPLLCYVYLMWYGFVGCKKRRKDVQNLEAA